MKFKKIVTDYLSELGKEVDAGKKSKQATAELSYRTSLDNFFKQIASSIDEHIVTILEPKNQSKVGRPDWRFHNSETMGVYGYVEAKGLDETLELDFTTYEAQVERYLILGNPVILTDGIDFILVKPNGEVVKHSLCQKPIQWDNRAVNLETESLFREFFGLPGYRTVSENQLVGEVAARATLLKNDIIEFLHLDDDEAGSASELKTLLLLKDLQQIARTSHDKTLESDESFASFISQILTFGLLYAHRVIAASNETPLEKYNRIHDFWFNYLDEDYTGRLLPFRSLVHGLKSELTSDLSRLGLWYDDLRRLLSYIRLSSKQVEMPDFHELYESFLSVYDPETRFDYGAFYTPRYLAFYMVRLAERIISNSISSKIDFKKGAHKIIDPCCGTGTFIEAVLKSLSPSHRSNIVGFEILPAPYALAHYRVSMLQDSYPNHVKIILTNTLSDNLFTPSEDKGEADETLTGMLLREQREAYNLATPPITLIIGNPPSSDSKFQVDNEGAIIKQLLDDFRPPLTDRTGRQNTQKQLSNEFVKFLRWTVDRALNSRPSVFVLIIPSSFAKHTSYKFARKYLIEKFNELWVLDFDNDNRRGTGDSNVFQTLQGRLILVGVCNSPVAPPAKLLYKSITSSHRSDKITFFKDEDIRLSEWTVIQCDEENYSLKPIEDYDRDLYSKFWALSDKSDGGIFYRHCSSLKLAPTHLLVHASSGQLKRRAKFIAREENDFDAIKDRWYSGQRKPPPKNKITAEVRKRLGKAAEGNSIVPYSYRPFLETSAIINNDLLEELQKLGGGGTRDRPEIRKAFQDNNVFGFAVSPAPEDIGESLHKFSSFCWHIPDNDLSARGNAHIFCNRFPEYRRTRNWNASIKSNINSKLLESLAQLVEMEDLNELADRVTFYAYAVLSSEFYLQEFKGKLFTVAGEWPRIPVTNNKELFLEISNIGQSLAKLETKPTENSVLSSGEPDIVYHKYRLEENSIYLLTDDGVCVKEITNVPEGTLSFNVSGYNVLKEWLKLHSFPYYRKELEGQKIDELKDLIERIDVYMKQIDGLDHRIKQIIEEKLLLQSNG